MIFSSREDLIRFLNAEDEITKTGFDSYTDPVKRDFEKAVVIAFRQGMTLELLAEAPLENAQSISE